MNGVVLCPFNGKALKKKERKIPGHSAEAIYLSRDHGAYLVPVKVTA